MANMNGKTNIESPVSSFLGVCSASKYQRALMRYTKNGEAFIINTFSCLMSGF
jgi:hypothetical protein